MSHKKWWRTTDTTPIVVAYICSYSAADIGNGDKPDHFSYKRIVNLGHDTDQTQHNLHPDYADLTLMCLNAYPNILMKTDWSSFNITLYVFIIGLIKI